MKGNKILGFFTDTVQYTRDHPGYRRAFLLKTVLLAIFGVHVFYTVIDFLAFSLCNTVGLNAVGAVLSLVVFVYFRKSGNLDRTSYFAVAIMAFAMIVFFHMVRNQNYAFCWIAVFPPVVYFLLGHKKARILSILFGGYLLLFILAKKSGWQPAEFNTESVCNLGGSMFALVLLISFFERSRKEASDELTHTNKLLEESKNELRLILDSVAEGVYGINPFGICTFCNARCLELLGYEHEQDLIGKNMHVLIHHKRQDGFALPMSECNIHRASVAGEMYHAEDEVFWRADGTSFPVEYYMFPKYRDCAITGSVVTFTDISKRKSGEERIRYLSSHDALTGLINRQCFQEEIKKFDKVPYYPISILYGDINGLKLTNDVFGHEAGDRLIRTAADVMKKVCRKNDVVARTGGDEFIWILPNTDKAAAGKIIDRIKEELQKVKLAGISAGISLGADTKYSPDEDVDQTIKDAESAMYREKAYDTKNKKSLILQELIEAFHEKNARAKGHSESVSRLCEKMGATLGWSAAEIKRIKDAGYFHDIGKIVLNEEMLSPDRELTKQEKIEEKHHAVVGYRILNLFINTLDLAEAVYYHHEEWDGSGYPKGLKEEEIPLLSRIIAIVDQYERLISPPNGLPLDREEAILRLRELSGIKLDPRLTGIFIGMLGTL